MESLNGQSLKDGIRKQKLEEGSLETPAVLRGVWGKVETAAGIGDGGR